MSGRFCEDCSYYSVNDPCQAPGNKIVVTPDDLITRSALETVGYNWLTYRFQRKGWSWLDVLLRRCGKSGRWFKQRPIA